MINFPIFPKFGFVDIVYFGPEGKLYGREYWPTPGVLFSFNAFLTLVPIFHSGCLLPLNEVLYFPGPGLYDVSNLEFSVLEAWPKPKAGA